MPNSLLREHAPSADELANADELGHELIRLMRLVTRAKAQFAKHAPDGIERAAYAILARLICEGPQRTSKLAESLYSEISTISRQSSALVEHGYIERQADPNDGRACLLAATEEGRRVFEQNRRQRTQWIAAALADWPAADRAALTTLFERFNTTLEKHTPQPVAAESAAAQGDTE